MRWPSTLPSIWAGLSSTKEIPRTAVPRLAVKPAPLTGRSLIHLIRQIPRPCLIAKAIQNPPCQHLNGVMFRPNRGAKASQVVLIHLALDHRDAGIAQQYGCHSGSIGGRADGECSQFGGRRAKFAYRRLTRSDWMGKTSPTSVQCAQHIAPARMHSYLLGNRRV